MSNDIRRRPEGALLRTYLSAAGVSQESFGKPHVGVATVATQVFSEKPFVRELGQTAASAIESEGGLVIRWDTVRSPELMTWGHADGYSFAWRDQLADFIESWTKQQALDALVLVGDATETLVGMAMAAARLNLPALIIPAGTTRSDNTPGKETNGTKKKTSADPYERLANYLFMNKKNADGPEKEVSQFEECRLNEEDHAGHVIDLVFEALGLCLPGLATAISQSPKQQELAYNTGSRVMALIKAGIGFRRALTLNSFTNAIRLNAALGGSIDAAIHLMALAGEAGVHLSLDLFDRVSRQTPQLCLLGGVGPSKATNTIEDLNQAGGVWAVLHAFKSQISPTNTLCGKGAMELARSTQIKDTRIIHATRPIRKQSGLGVLKGNLAVNGAVFLLNQVAAELQHFKGPVQIFENEIDAATAVNEGTVKKGDFLIVRGQGPKGGPGLRKLRILPALLESRGLNKSVPVLTDGRFPDKPSGLFISLVSPEGTVQGPLSVMKNGDEIVIDIEARVLSVRLTDTELRIRLARWQSPEPKVKRGFLERYSRYVSEVNEGAVLK